MFSLLFLLICLSSAPAQADVFFKNLGHLSSNLKNYKIQIDLDLTRFNESLQTMQTTVNDFSKLLKSSKYKNPKFKNAIMDRVIRVRYLNKRAMAKMDHIHLILKNKSNPQLKRKRSIFAALGLVAIGAYLGNNLFNNIRDMYHDDDIPHRVDITEQTIRQHELKLEYLNDTMTRIMAVEALASEERNELEDSERILAQLGNMEWAMELINNEVDDVEYSIHEAIKNKISIKLIPIATAKDIISNIKILSTYVPVINLANVAEFYSIPITAFAKSNRISLVIELPCYESTNLMHLYELQPIPILDKHRGILISFDQSKDILARGKYGAWSHMELTHRDLQKCQKLSNIFICPDLRVIKNGKSSCLITLFLNDIELAHKLCNYKLQALNASLHPEAYYLGNNEFQVITPVDIRTTKRCGKSKVKLEIPRGSTRLKLDKGCAVNMDNLGISTLPNPIKKEVEIISPVNSPELMNVSELVKNNGITINGEIEKLFQDMGNAKGQLEMGLREIKQKFQLEKKETSTRTSLIINLVISICGFLGMVAVSSWVMYRYCKFSKAQSLRVKGLSKPKPENQ